MATSHKKLTLILVVVIGLVAVLFWYQAKRFFSITITASPQPLISDSIFDLPITTSTRLIGNPGAALTLTYFFDLNDPKSRSFLPTLIQFANAHPSDARLVLQDFPIDHLFSAPATLAHRAAWCAGDKQGAFLSTVSVRPKTVLDQTQLTHIASELGLNIAAWESCLSSSVAIQALADSQTLGRTLGMQTVPTLFVNYKELNLNADFNLKQLLDSLITP